LPQKLFELGAAQYLHKPVHFNHLIHEISRRLEEIGREGLFAEADVICAEMEAELILLERALETLKSEGALCES
jgi:hypothetical protein